MKICYFGSYSIGPAYSRTTTFLKALNRKGYSVSVCHTSLWKRSEDKLNLSIANLIIYFLSFLKSNLILAFKFIKYNRKSDIIFVGTSCFQDLPLAYLLSRIFKKNLIFDAFFSLYDTIVLDRKLLAENSFLSKTLKQLEGLLYKIPDSIIMDTKQNVEYIKKTYNIKKVLYFIPPGVPSEFIFKEDVLTSKKKFQASRSFNCVFYGSYVPLQGAEIIVRSALYLRNMLDIKFVMIGAGQQFGLCREIAEKNSLDNIVFKPWMTIDNLSNEVREADLCLGIFGVSPKAFRVIPYKVYSYMAAKKPIITMNSPAIRDFFVDHEEALLCKPGDSKMLSELILELRDNRILRSSIANMAFLKYLKTSSIEVIAEKLFKIIESTY